jgi:hypothetical protein
LRLKCGERMAISNRYLIWGPLSQARWNDITSAENSQRDISFGCFYFRSFCRTRANNFNQSIQDRLSESQHKMEIKRNKILVNRSGEKMK